MGTDIGKMESASLTPDECKQLFISILAEVAYNASLEAITQQLETSPAGGSPPSDLVHLHEWFKSLDETNKQSVFSVVKTATHLAVFQCCVLLDGAAGGYPVQGQVSEFALYLKTYENIKSLMGDNARTSVKINGRGSFPELHDLFNALTIDNQSLNLK